MPTNVNSSTSSHTVALYQDILADPCKDRPNIVKLFAGKAAPSYDFANDCICLVNLTSPR